MVCGGGVVVFGGGVVVCGGVWWGVVWCGVVGLSGQIGTRSIPGKPR